MADMTELEQMKAKLEALKAQKAKLEAEKAKLEAENAEKPAESAKIDLAKKEEPKAEGKPEVKLEAKPVAKEEPKEEPKKEEPKAEEKPAAKEESKSEEKPAVKPAVKPVAKPAAKPAAKPVAKPAAKPVAKPVAKPAAKPATKPSSPYDDPEYREMMRRKTRKINLIIIGMTAAITLILCAVVVTINLLRGGTIKNPLKNEVKVEAQKVDKELKQNLYGQEGQDEPKEKKITDPFEIAYNDLNGQLKKENLESANTAIEDLLYNINVLQAFLDKWRDKSDHELYKRVEKLLQNKKGTFEFYNE